MQQPPAVDDQGRIFLHAGGRLVAIEQREGKPEVCWEYVTGSHAPGPVVIAPDGSLRLHCSDGMLHFLTRDGKQINAPEEVGEPLGYAAPVVDAGGATYISAYDGGLIRVGPDGKRQKPGSYLRTRQKLDAPGIIHESTLYVGSEEGYIFAVELGERRGRNRWDHSAEVGHAGWYIRAGVAVTDDELLVVAGRDEHLYGFHPDGRTAFRTLMPGQMLGSPVIDRLGHIYVGISQAERGKKPAGLLVCLDGNSHKVRWQYQAAGPVEATPVIGDDDVIYLGDNEGLIHAVDFSGSGKWTAQVESPVRSAGTIVGPGRVAFGQDNETLIVLECSSKALAVAGWPKFGRTLANSAL